MPTCCKCSAELPPDAPEGLCPACLMRGGLNPTASGIANGFQTEALFFTDVADSAGFKARAGVAHAAIPTEIGPYRILELLGEGGMGTVYKAEQRKPVNRIVALKVIKLGLGSAEVIARFESERQALARMDHPNIAKVLDAGQTETGQLYFAMVIRAADVPN